MKLSILYPTHNESQNIYFRENLERFGDLDCANTEILFADSGSDDITVDLIKEHNFKVLQNAGNSRGERLQNAFLESQGQLILLHHPRSILGPTAFEKISNLQVSQFRWGYFKHQFDDSHPLLSFTSWYSNNIRSKFRSIIYLDHCLLIRRDLLLHVGGIPQIDIFEDTKLSEGLREICSAAPIDCVSRTSAIRFREGGLFKHSLKNQYLKLKYLFGGYSYELNEIYESRKPLNSSSNEVKKEVD